MYTFCKNRREVTNLESMTKKSHANIWVDVDRDFCLEKGRCEKISMTLKHVLKYGMDTHHWPCGLDAPARVLVQIVCRIYEILTMILPDMFIIY